MSSTTRVEPTQLNAELLAAEPLHKTPHAGGACFLVDHSADQRVIALSIAPYEEYSKHYTGQTTWNAWSWEIVQDLLVSPT